MIITLLKHHTAAQQLSDLCAQLRALRRGDVCEVPAEFMLAVDVDETSHGNGTTTYTVHPGKATSEQAILAYQCIRRRYPGVLDLLCHAADKNAGQLTIEIGAAHKESDLSYSQHDLLRIMPRILALFRGTLSTA